MRKTEKLPEGLRREKNGIIYMNFRFLGKKINRSTKTQDATTAFEMLRAEKERMMNSMSSAKVSDGGEELTLGQAIDITWDEVHSKQAQAKTIKYTRDICKELIGETPLSQVKRRTFLKLKQLLIAERGVSQNTVNHYYTFLNTVLNHMDKVHEAPCMKIPGVKESFEAADIVEISPEIEAKMFEWLSNPVNFKRSPFKSEDMVDLFKVAIGTGMRRSELLTFRVNQLQGRVIYFSSGQHKSGLHSGGKRVVLSVEMESILRQRISRKGLVDTDIVFPYCMDTITRLVPRMRLQMGIREEITFHSCRHTFATRMLRAKVPIKSVSLLMGHSSVSTTEIYTHLLVDDLLEAVDSVGVPSVPSVQECC